MNLERLKIVPALGWLLMSALFFSGGEFLSKKWGEHPGLGLTVAIVVLYATGTLMWLPALLHKNELARMGMLWYLLTTPLTVILGVVVFHEKLTSGQWVGVALAMIALWFLS